MVLSTEVAIFSLINVGSGFHCLRSNSIQVDCAATAHMDTHTHASLLPLLYLTRSHFV
jgi:hypothetical protein